MNVLNTIFILAAAFLAVFCEASLGGLRRVLGVQFDLLPGLIIYASLSAGLTTVAFLAVTGGLWFDSLSANPLGASILPLFIAGFLVQRWHHLILRDQAYAQFVVGAGASAGVPLMTLLLITMMGQSPLIGWGTLWQLLMMGLVGGALTPLYFRLFGWIEKTLSYQPLPDGAFRSERQIKRGRS